MSRLPYIFVLFVSTFVVNNCAEVYTRNPQETTHSKNYNISYGNQAHQRLNLFLPERCEKSMPLVVLLHGGAWMFGQKETLEPVQEFLLEHNIASVSVDYQLVNETITYRNQLEDVAQAVRFLQESADSLCLPDKIVLMGESAGGHLALLFGNRNPEIIEKVIALAAPTDLFSEDYRKNKLYHWYTKLFFEQAIGKDYGRDFTPTAFKEASPVANVPRVPTLILQGTNDIVVQPGQAARLSEAMKKAQVSHKLVMMEGGIHIARRIPYFRDNIIYPEVLHFLANASSGGQLADN